MEEANRMMNGISQDGYTIGIGLTDRCDSNCPHCYSRPVDGPRDLDYDLICRLIDAIPIKSINFGTGESILYPRFNDVLRMLADRDIEIAVTTGGATIAEISDKELCLFHDVDFSIDFPDQTTNDKWRGEGAFQSVMEGARRCLDLGVEASLVACLMKENSVYMGRLAELAAQMGLSLRVNVYKSVFTRKHQPTYEEFWAAIRDMAEAAYLTACSEPIVSAAIGNNKQKGGNPCGRMSFRVHPDAKIVPCVYLKESDITVEDLIADFDTCQDRIACALNLPLPKICQDCSYLEICNGGCASRRILGNPREPDEYCFVVKDERPDIKPRWKESKGLVHEDYLCTMIFSG